MLLARAQQPYYVVPRALRRACASWGRWTWLGVAIGAVQQVERSLEGEEAARPHKRRLLLPLTNPSPTLHTNHRHTPQALQPCVAHLTRRPAGAGCRFWAWWLLLSASPFLLLLSFFSSFGGLCVGRTSGRTAGPVQQHRCAVVGLSGVCVSNGLAPDEGKAHASSFLPY